MKGRDGEVERSQPERARTKLAAALVSEKENEGEGYVRTQDFERLLAWQASRRNVLKGAGLAALGTRFVTVVPKLEIV